MTSFTPFIFAMSAGAFCALPWQQTGKKELCLVHSKRGRTVHQTSQQEIQSDEIKKHGFYIYLNYRDMCGCIITISVAVCIPHWSASSPIQKLIDCYWQSSCDVRKGGAVGLGSQMLRGTWEDLGTDIPNSWVNCLYMTWHTLCQVNSSTIYRVTGVIQILSDNLGQFTKL